MEVKGICPKADFARTLDMTNGMIVIRYDEHDADNGMVEFSEQSCKTDDVSVLISQLIREDINRREMFSQWKDEAWYKEAVQNAVDAVIQKKLQAITAYDSSDAVNSFTLGGVSMWIDFNERARIRQSIDAYRNEGKTEMTKWFNGKAFTFPLDTWKTMLDKLSVYASEALNVTERHKAEVNALTSIEAVEGYDYKTGYPEKLSFATTPDAAISK